MRNEEVRSKPVERRDKLEYGQLDHFQRSQGPRLIQISFSVRSTLAFLVPIVQRYTIRGERCHEEPQLIIAPAPTHWYRHRAYSRSRHSPQHESKWHHEWLEHQLYRYVYEIALLAFIYGRMADALCLPGRCGAGTSRG
jgi:hypothetical protein